MSVRTKTRREAVAYHGAGHAVVAHKLGYQVRRVSIAPKSGSAGHVSWRHPINRSVNSSAVAKQTSTEYDIVLITRSSFLWPEHLLKNATTRAPAGATAALG